MKIIYTVECCNKRTEFNWEYQAHNFLLDHIEKEHKNLYEELIRNARELARSQNGLGYWDSDSKDGWNTATPYFRRAWIRNALEQYIRSRKNL